MKQASLKLSLIAMGFACATTVSANSSDTSRPERGQPPSVEQAFEMMDSDKDNQLSQSEVKGPLARHFSQVDSNNDGYITKTELENAPRPKRPQR